MICPNDGRQMHQYKKVGGGVSQDDYYETWELKMCPLCKRIVKEFYSVKVMSEGDLERIMLEKEEKYD